jgi:ABC-type oligopeptide transport system substrate-binding subunit
MAINKQAIVDAVFQGAATPAKNPIPPTMWSYNDAVKDDKYDPEAPRRDARSRWRQGPQDEGLGDAGRAPLHARTPAARPS